MLLFVQTACGQPATPALAASGGTEAPQVIDAVDFLYWNSLEPPPDNAAWAPLTLPFNSREERAPVTARDPESPYVWFRFVLEKPVQEGRHSLYFWRYNLALTVFFNGSEIGGSSYRENRDTMSWNHPLLVEIQEPSWRPGQNEVLVRLYRSAWGGNFAPMLFGETSSLQQLWSERMFRQVEINEVLLAFGIGLTLVSFFLWGVRRNDTVYLWFSGMCLCWSIVTLHMIIYHNPIPYDYWLPLVHVGIDGAIFCMYGFIGRLIDGAQRRRREQLLLGWTVLAALSHFLVSPEYFFMVAYCFHLVGTIALGAIVWRVAAQALHYRKRQAIIITGAMAIQITLFMHNIFLMFFAPIARWEGSIFYAHFGIPLLFMIFVGSLLSRFTSALETAENLNRELEYKVELSRQVIEKGFAERRVLEIQQAAEQERLKIYRDLHDDVGSKLLSIMHADRGSKLGDMARSALESLRQAVSKANNPDQQLGSFLNDIREETELRLRGSGHDVVWTQSAAAPAVIVPSAVAFNLNRILKEIVSNIIRHAEAQHVQVQAELDGAGIEFIIHDDGRGFDRYGPLGNGINNIISRAKEIDASVSWHSEPGAGTTISIVVPAGWTPAVNEQPT
ncbi:MAG: ATP-binding protein [Pseudomonadota bacterium]